MSDIGLVDQRLPASSVRLHRAEDADGVLERAEDADGVLERCSSGIGGAQHSASIASQLYLEAEVSNRTDSPVEVRSLTHDF